MQKFSTIPSWAIATRSLGVFLLLLAIRLPAEAQVPAWQSAQAVAVATATATDNSSTVAATAVDAAGNVYLAGSFNNSVEFGAIKLTSLGGQDVFVAKFNPGSNQFVWAQRAGGGYDDVAQALVVNGTSVYVAGNFSSSTAAFGLSTLTNGGQTDLFVAKLTDAGNTSSFAWAQRAGGSTNENATALAVNGASVYVAGSFTSPTADFGPVTLINNYTSSSEVFVAKLTDTGNAGSFLWGLKAGGSTNDSAYALAVSGTSVYVAGKFENDAYFGSITLSNPPRSSGQSSITFDAFVAKLTDAGNTASFAWAQRAGGVGYDNAYALAVSGTSVYVAGSFTSPTANLGSIILANAGLTIGDADAFVAKLTDAGNTGSFVWAQRAGGISSEFINALAINGTSIFVVGTFASATISFGATTLTNANPANFDVFMAKLTDLGSTASFTWAKRAGGTNYESATAVAVSNTSLYMAGYYQSATIGFDNITLSNPTPTTRLGFLASLTDATLTATSVPANPRESGHLFPNPARHAATLRLPAGTTPAPLILTDALGRAVRRYPVPTGAEASLDLRGLSPGLYLLHGAGPARQLVVE